MHYYKYSKAISSYLLIFFILFTSIGNCKSHNASFSKALFDRELYKPFKPIYIGGYINSSINYFNEEGQYEGLQPSLNHLGIIGQINLFRYLNVYGEFEYDQTRKFHVNSLFAQIGTNNIGLRFGYLGFPLGRYKQYHIKKSRHFVEHPLIITRILPGISCDAGAGIYASLGNEDYSKISFELNFVTGLNEKILYTPSANTEMQLGASKSLKINDNNSNLMMNARVGLLQNKVFNIGASILAGTYTDGTKEAATMFTKSKKLQIYVFDIALYFKKLSIESEIAVNNIELPENIRELYAENQRGSFIDISCLLFKKDNFLLNKPLKIYAVGRYDFIDLNNGYLNVTNEKITDEYHRITVGLSAQLFNKTSIILNGSYQLFSDLLGNPYKKTAGIQLGLASFL